jgi:thimet oligopeptidase
MVSEAQMTEPTLAFAHSADEVASVAKDRLDRARQILAQILEVEGTRTVANTLVPFNDLMVEVAEVSVQGEALFNLHPDPGIREAGNKAYQDAKSFETELSLNRELYEAFDSLNVEGEDEETRFAVFKILRDFRRAGVDRDEATRARIKELRDEIIAIGSRFDRNINEDVRSIQVESAEELEGLPEDYVNAHPPGEDGKITITTNYPDVVPIFSYAKNADVRRRLLWEFHNRAHPANLELLRDLMAKRHELARTLDYDHYASYVTEDKMIGSAEAAAEFIERITKAAATRASNDYAELLERKRKDDPEADSLDPWDARYYSERVRAENYSFDAKEARPYFEFERVREGIFDITGRLFGVRYERVDGVTPWEPTVEVYDVYDGDDILGRFYLDLHPRDGKFSHAAATEMVMGVRGRQLPQAALMCNFPDPTATDGPALMEHSDVVTFFHEFGHLLHMIFSGHGRWLKNGGMEVEWDFVEAPSQMLEEWTRDAESLQTFARHYETGEPIPEDLVKRMVGAEAVSRGVFVRGQMAYAAISLNFYNRSPEGLDTTEYARELYSKYSLVPWYEGTHFQCSFGHLNNYSAVYYTYMWSLVIAKDLFSLFKGQGSLLDTSQSRRYRETILEPGSALPAAEMVKRFLGREPSFDPFEEWLNTEAGG